MPVKWGTMKKDKKRKATNIDVMTVQKNQKMKANERKNK